MIRSPEARHLRRIKALTLAAYDQVHAELTYQLGLACFVRDRVVAEDIHERRAVVIEAMQGIEKELAS